MGGFIMKITNKNGVKEIILSTESNGFGGDYWKIYYFDLYRFSCKEDENEEIKLDKLTQDFSLKMRVYIIHKGISGRMYEIYSSPYKMKCYFKMYSLNALLKNVKKYKTVDGIKYYFNPCNWPYMEVSDIGGVCKAILFN